MKGTVIITIFGIIIFLVAAFFAFFSFDKLVSNDIICILQQGSGCLDKMSTALSYGLYIIITLIIMIIAATYVMVKNMAMELEKK